MKNIIIATGIILFCLVSLLAIMLFIRGEEDTWIYSNGRWVKHGVPAGPPPFCGIENCHGLIIICGPNIPQVCTEIYQLGDFCRQFAKCGIVGSDCLKLESPNFDKCKSCVKKCEPLDSAEAFDCENECRKLF